MPDKGDTAGAANAEAVIRAQGLSKVYPLADSTRARLLYVLGFGRTRGGETATKAAVDAIDLEIRRGEKIGIIGRNGSGKSTLLGMISGTIEPTAGRLSVRGNIHALLQLGAGFNNELTGRQNAYSYLAMQGVAGGAADSRVAQIAEFAEIGAYFDQPVKTYSSGMRLRLMFAAATSVTPDILVLDEVLSVGDAYFIGKSFERMRQITAGEGTTLIVVSHAVAMLTELCDRLVWMDNGVVRMDDEPENVAKAYNTWVRAEEENRLRRLQAETPVRQLSSLPGDGRAEGEIATERSVESRPSAAMTGEIRCPDGQPPEDELMIHALEFWQSNERIAEFRPGSGETAGDAVLLTRRGEGNWGPFVEADGESGRAFMTFGSPFHKLPFLLTVDGIRARIEAGDIEVRLRCTSATDIALEVQLFAEEPAARWRAELAVPAGQRASMETATLRSVDVEEESERPSAVSVGRFGTRRIAFESVEFLGEDDQPRLVFNMASQFRVRIRYRINDPDLDEKAEVAVAMQRDGLQVANRFFLNEYRFSAAARREGEILLDATPLLLAPGEYVVSAAVHAAGHATRKTPRDHVSVSHTVYDMYYRCFHITVFEPYHTTLLKDVIFQHPAKWVVDSEVFQKTVVTD